MGQQTLGEEGQPDGTRRSGEETGNSVRKGYMAAAAAMATIGVVEQAGQLSY